LVTSHTGEVGVAELQDALSRVDLIRDRVPAAELRALLVVRPSPLGASTHDARSIVADSSITRRHSVLAAAQRFVRWHGTAQHS
jgi:hypothetical protein